MAVYHRSSGVVLGIELDAIDLEWVADTAVGRNRAQRGAHRGDGVMLNRDSIITDYEGAMGERVVEVALKAAAQRPVLDMAEFDRVRSTLLDVDGTIEVRATSQVLSKCSLIAKRGVDESKKDKPFVLVRLIKGSDVQIIPGLGEIPVYSPFAEIRRWAYGRDVIHPDNWRDESTGVTKAAWFLHWGVLRPTAGLYELFNRELPPTVDPSDFPLDMF
jgi:hypothetical protein